MQSARVVYCKLPTNGKQLPAFPLKAVTGIEPRPQRWEARVLPLCHRGPPQSYEAGDLVYKLDSAKKVGQSQKLQKVWKGPFLVVEVVSAVLFRIADRKKTHVLHHDRLKP